MSITAIIERYLSFIINSQQFEIQVIHIFYLDF